MSAPTRRRPFLIRPKTTTPTKNQRKQRAEIDAVGTKRYETQSGGEREIQRTMLELLNQLDGFDAMSEVKARCDWLG